MSRIRLAGIIPMKDGFALMHRKDVKKIQRDKNIMYFQVEGKKKMKHLKKEH